MKAVRFLQHGGPEVLQLEDIPKPSPQPGQVLLRVEAAGVNYADTVRRRGLFYPLPTPLPHICGAEVAGVVEAVGEGVDPGLVGKRLLGTPDGGAYAEYIALPLAGTFMLPEGIDPIKGAALLIQGLTAALVLKVSGALQPGQSVFIEGAVGGVGWLATQLARLYGAGTVIGGVGSSEKLEAAKALGLDAVVDYSQPGWGEQLRAATHGRAVDLVLDMAGGAIMDEGLNCLAPGGRMVIYGNASGVSVPIAPERLLAGGLTVTAFFLGAFLPRRHLIEETLEEMGRFVRDGKLKVQLGGVYSLSQAADAHRALESRRTVGKLVIVPGGASS